MLGPEVTEGPDGDRLAGKNTELIAKLLTFDAVVVAGQAKSHCLAWTIDDLLEHDEARERLARRTYLLEDCTSPVVVPGAVDYTDEADAAFERYAAAGMHIVRAADPIESWPGLAQPAGLTESPADDAARVPRGAVATAERAPRVAGERVDCRATTPVGPSATMEP